MLTHPLNRLVAQLRRSVPAAGDCLSDGQLLTQFLDQHDHEALQVLVKRHGPMVLGVCRRILGNCHDADDAFQAAFLILVHKAATIRPCERVGNWLYGVAQRTALAARARRRCRETQVNPMPEPAVTEPDDWSELRPLLDRELSQLADLYREAIVLCDLEGKTRKQAAQMLGIPEGTLSGRLTTARRLLAGRLARRGLTLSGAALAALLSQGAVSTCVPLPLLVSTIKAATATAAGAATAGVVSASVVALAEGVMKAMFLTKVKILSAVLLACFLAAGVLLIGQTPAAPVPVKEAKKEEPARKTDATFTALVVEGVGNVTLKQTGKENVSTDNPMLGHSEVKDGVLYLRGVSAFDVEVKELTIIVVKGACSLDARDLKGKQLALTLSDAGQATLAGAVDEQTITLTGAARCNAEALKGKNATVTVSGAAKLVVQISGTLKAEVSGAGGVEYVGKPMKLEDSVSDVGSIQQREASEPGEKPKQDKKDKSK